MIYGENTLTGMSFTEDDHKIRTYQVCSVHRFYWDAMPEMLNSVVIKVKLA
jgi:hypothetical protein